jgi:branched-chain amino acid transport system substrate-binding protein
MSRTTPATLQRSFLLTIFVVLGMLLAACGDTGDAETVTPETDAVDDDVEPYRIGALLGLTGAYSALGEPQGDAVRAYVEWINDQGGVNGRPLEVVIVDSTSSESEAVNQLRRLATRENVIGVIGPSSTGEGIAVRSAANEMEIPTMVMASSRAIVEPVEDSDWMFKNFPSTDLSLEAQLAHAQQSGYERVAILGANNAYGTEPVELIDELADDYGMEVVAKELFDPESTDMSAQLTSIRGAEPDLVLVWAVEPQNSIVARNADSLGFEPSVSHSPGAASQAFISNGGDAVEGHLVQGMKTLVPESVEADDPQHDTIQAFVEVYEEAHGELPGQFAGNAWDALLIISHALEAADIDPSDVEQARSELRTSIEENVRDFPGLNGIYTYGPDDHAGQTLRGLAVLGVKDGAFVLDTTIED